MSSSNIRRLPSVDGIAYAIAVIAWFSQYFTGHVLQTEFVIVMAIILPSALREMSLLHDADEWTRAVAHQSAFHALLAALVVFAAKLLVLIWAQSKFSDVDRVREALRMFDGDVWLKVTAGTFLVSYLLQFWGARTGSMRILIGIAVVSLAPAVYYIYRRPEMFWAQFIARLAIPVLFLGMALLVNKKPRFGGWSLLALGSLWATFVVWSVTRGIGFATPFALPALLSAVLQALLICGVCGLALVRESSTKAAQAQ